LGLFRTEYLAGEVAWVLFVVFLIFAAISFAFGRRTEPPL
jgi:hypothetical protein